MPNGSIDPTCDYVADFSARIGKPWPAIAAARNSATEVQQLLQEKVRAYSSGDVDVVAFGHWPVESGPVVVTWTGRC